MHNLWSNLKEIRENRRHLPKAVADKVTAALVEHVYFQIKYAIFASVFCATVIFIALFSWKNTTLFWWYGVFISVALLRSGLVFLFKSRTRPNIPFWRLAYIVSYTLAGLIWGISGIILLPYIPPTQQILLILMAAGVTAGVVPLSSAIPEGAIGFLIATIVPFLLGLIFLEDTISWLFEVTLAIYLIYTIALTVKGFHIIKKNIVLRFENELLLANLADATSQLELINKKLSISATHDPLTKVGNRDLFQANLQTAIQNALQNKSSLALLFLDIDRFKSINDTYGHEIGDEVLLTVTSRLKSYLRNNDIIARLGGDEFTIILEEILDTGDVRRIAADLCRIISLPMEIRHTRYMVTSSVGISLFPEDGDTVQTLIKRADQAMYFVKSNGGNDFSFYHESALTVA